MRSYSLVVGTTPTGMNIPWGDPMNRKALLAVFSAIAITGTAIAATDSHDITLNVDGVSYIDVTATAITLTLTPIDEYADKTSAAFDVNYDSVSTNDTETITISAITEPAGTNLYITAGTQSGSSECGTAASDSDLSDGATFVSAIGSELNCSLSGNTYTLEVDNLPALQPHVGTVQTVTYTLSTAG